MLVILVIRNSNIVTSFICVETLSKWFVRGRERMRECFSVFNVVSTLFFCSYLFDFVRIASVGKVDFYLLFKSVCANCFVISYLCGFGLCIYLSFIILYDFRKVLFVVQLFILLTSFSNCKFSKRISYIGVEVRSASLFLLGFDFFLTLLK